ncbi:MAG: hypothetical protein C4329_02380 [Chitinophagaceae bacterium]
MLPLIKHFKYQLFFYVFLFFIVGKSNAQVIVDSAGKVVGTTAEKKKIDSAVQNITPKKAAIRSALIPGWGQISVRKDLDASFFRKYWKIPVIYGALGTTAGVFFYNLKTYKDLRFAYRVLVEKDSANFQNVAPNLQPFVYTNAQSTLLVNRNAFRQNLDYSVLFFLIFWGLNVVDASVDAHLKAFDISPDLSLRFVPGYSEMAKTAGVSLVLAVK